MSEVATPVGQGSARIELRGKWGVWHDPGPGHSLSGEKPPDVAVAIARGLASGGAWIHTWFRICAAGRSTSDIIAIVSSRQRR